VVKRIRKPKIASSSNLKKIEGEGRQLRQEMFNFGDFGPA